MIVSDCKQYESIRAIKCYTVDYSDSLCMCSGSVKRLNQRYERLKNTDLYHIDFLGNFDQRKSFFYSKKEPGLYDCLAKSRNAVWTCSAYKSKLHHSACSCYDSKFEFFHVGSIPTDELFQNMNNSYFPHSNVTDMDDRIDLNVNKVHMDKENDRLNKYGNISFLQNGYNFINHNLYLFMAFIPILMLIIIIILRKQLRRRIRLKNYSKLHLKNLIT